MKSTGIVRRIDELGRLVIPMELRRAFNLRDNVDSLEIFVEGDTIILKKYEPSCIFCDSADDVEKFKGRNICAKCLGELAKN